MATATNAYLAKVALQAGGRPPGLRPRKVLRKELSAEEREEIVRPYLPPLAPDTGRFTRDFLASRFYRLILAVINLIFSVYLRLRFVKNTVLNRGYSAIYYHHRTPQLIQKDVKQLTRLPHHISIILQYDPSDKVSGLDTLIDDVAEVACWCASAGIPVLSVYEQTGILKGYITTSHRAIAQRLHAYFGRERPTVRVRAPHSMAFANGDAESKEGKPEEVDLELLFISEEDGRESLVDLTKTLCEMAQTGKISSEDVTQELVDAEISGNIMSEPDLLVLFSPRVTLMGYPPWQIRLTEIFHVQDSEGVGYHVFLRALYKYAKAQMRFGR